MSSFAYNPEGVSADTLLAEHDDAWQEFDDEKTQVFMGSARNYYYKGEGRRIPHRLLSVFAILDQAQLSNQQTGFVRDKQLKSMENLDSFPESPQCTQNFNQPFVSAGGTHGLGQQVAHVGGPLLYEPLPPGEFTRFLEILPASQGPVRCHLHTARISDCIFKYEALSLKSGADVNFQSENLLCNQVEVRCKKSLYNALEKLRAPDRPRLIWVAPLCIDLSNVNERNHHVQLSASIFKNAHRVVVPLEMGMNDDPSIMFSSICKVVNTWRRRCALEELVEEADFSLVATPNMAIAFSSEKRHPASESETWLEAIKLFENGWFRSTWSVQEISVARTAIIVSGNSVISWDWVGLAAGIIRENYGRLPQSWNPDWTPGKRTVPDSGILCAYFMYRVSVSQRPFRPLQPTLRQLLSLTRGFQCKLEHDKIYSLIGVPMLDNTSSQIIADYTQPVTKVYQDVACLIMQASNSLDMLSEIRHNHSAQGLMPGGRYIKDLVLNGPSWVPQWRWHDSAIEAISPLHPCPEFSTAAHLPAKLQISSDRSRLAIQVTFVDTVTRATDARYDYVWRGRVDDRGGFGTNSQTPESVPDTAKVNMNDLRNLALTVTGGKDWMGLPVSDLDKHLADYARCLLRGGLGWSLEWIRNIKENPSTRMDDDVTLETLKRLSVGGNADRILDAVATFGVRRSQFITITRLWGIAPDATQAGDILCSIHGANVPYIIRSCGNGCFSIVGECYVRGMMTREGMEALRSHPGYRTADSWIQIV